MCNYCFTPLNLSIKWIHEAFCIKGSSEVNVILDVMLTDANGTSEDEGYIGIVQSGLVLPSEIELLQETFAGEKQEFNLLVGSKKHYNYRIIPETEEIEVLWGRPIDWAPIRRAIAKIVPQDKLRIETWPNIPELVKLANISFPQLSESNFIKTYECSPELRNFLNRNVPFTVIVIKGFHGNDLDQIFRLKLKLSSRAYVVSPNNYVYKIYGPKNIWEKLGQSIRLMEHEDSKRLFQEKYEETLEGIEVPYFDLQILVDPSLVEMFLSAPILERRSHIVTWPFSAHVSAWAHSFSFPSDKQNFLIELKTVLLRAREKHEVTVAIDSETAIKNIAIDQVAKLAEELNLDENEKTRLRQALHDFIKSNAEKKGLNVPPESLDLLGNILIFLSDKLVCQIGAD